MATNRAFPAWSAQTNDRVCVTVRGALTLGTLRFLGPTKFKGGEWAGVELDEDRGTHGGTLRGVAYFTCRYGRGVFVRSSALMPASAAATLTSTGARAADDLRASLRASQRGGAAGSRRPRLPVPSPSVTTTSSSSSRDGGENIAPATSGADRSPAWKRRTMARGTGQRHASSPPVAAAAALSPPPLPRDGGLLSARVEAMVRASGGTPLGTPPPSQQQRHTTPHIDAAVAERALSLGFDPFARGAAKVDTPSLPRAAPSIAGANAFGELSVDLFHAAAGRGQQGAGGARSGELSARYASASFAAADLERSSRDLGVLRRSAAADAIANGVSGAGSSSNNSAKEEDAASHRRVHRLLLNRLEDAQEQVRSHIAALALCNGKLDEAQRTERGLADELERRSTHARQIEQAMSALGRRASLLDTAAQQASAEATSESVAARHATLALRFEGEKLSAAMEDADRATRGLARMTRSERELSSAAARAADDAAKARFDLEMELRSVEAAAAGAAHEHTAELSLIALTHAAAETRLEHAARNARAEEAAVAAGVSAQVGAVRRELERVVADRKKLRAALKKETASERAQRVDLEAQLDDLTTALHAARHARLEATRRGDVELRAALDESGRSHAAEAERRLQAAVENAVAQSSRDAAAQSVALRRIAEATRRQLRSAEGEVAVLCDEVQSLRLVNGEFTKSNKRTQRLLDQALVERTEGAAHEVVARKLGTALHRAREEQRELQTEAFEATACARELASEMQMLRSAKEAAVRDADAAARTVESNAHLVANARAMVGVAEAATATALAEAAKESATLRRRAAECAALGELRSAAEAKLGAEARRSEALGAELLDAQRALEAERSAQVAASIELRQLKARRGAAARTRSVEEEARRIDTLSEASAAQLRAKEAIANAERTADALRDEEQRVVAVSHELALMVLEVDAVRSERDAEVGARERALLAVADADAAATWRDELLAQAAGKAATDAAAAAEIASQQLARFADKAAADLKHCEWRIEDETRKSAAAYEAVEAARADLQTHESRSAQLAAQARASLRGAREDKRVAEARGEAAALEASDAAEMRDRLRSALAIAQDELKSAHAELRTCEERAVAALSASRADAAAAMTAKMGGEMLARQEFTVETLALRQEILDAQSKSALVPVLEQAIAAAQARCDSLCKENVQQRMAAGKGAAASTDLAAERAMRRAEVEVAEARVEAMGEERDAAQREAASAKRAASAAHVETEYAAAASADASDTAAALRVELIAARDAAAAACRGAAAEADAASDAAREVQRACADEVATAARAATAAATKTASSALAQLRAELSAAAEHAAIASSERDDARAAEATEARLAAHTSSTAEAILAQRLALQTSTLHGEHAVALMAAQAGAAREREAFERERAVLEADAARALNTHRVEAERSKRSALDAAADVNAALNAAVDREAAARRKSATLQKRVAQLDVELAATTAESQRRADTLAATLSRADALSATAAEAQAAANAATAQRDEERSAATVAVGERSAAAAELVRRGLEHAAARERAAADLESERTRVAQLTALVNDAKDAVAASSAEVYAAQKEHRVALGEEQRRAAHDADAAAHTVAELRLELDLATTGLQRKDAELARSATSSAAATTGLKATVRALRDELSAASLSADEARGVAAKLEREASQTAEAHHRAAETETHEATLALETRLSRLTAKCAESEGALAEMRSSSTRHETTIVALKARCLQSAAGVASSDEARDEAAAKLATAVHRIASFEAAAVTAAALADDAEHAASTSRAAHRTFEGAMAQRRKAGHLRRVAGEAVEVASLSALHAETAALRATHVLEISTLLWEQEGARSGADALVAEQMNTLRSGLRDEHLALIDTTAAETRQHAIDLGALRSAHDAAIAAANDEHAATLETFERAAHDARALEESAASSTRGAEVKWEARAAVLSEQHAAAVAAHASAANEATRVHTAALGSLRDSHAAELLELRTASASQRNAAVEMSEVHAARLHAAALASAREEYSAELATSSAILGRMHDAQRAETATDHERKANATAASFARNAADEDESLRRALAIEVDALARCEAAYSALTADSSDAVRAAVAESTAARREISELTQRLHSAEAEAVSLSEESGAALASARDELGTVRTELDTVKVRAGSASAATTLEAASLGEQLRCVEATAAAHREEGDAALLTTRAALYAARAELDAVHARAAASVAEASVAHSEAAAVGARLRDAEVAAVALTLAGDAALDATNSDLAAARAELAALQRSLLDESARACESDSELASERSALETERIALATRAAEFETEAVQQEAIIVGIQGQCLRLSKQLQKVQLDPGSERSRDDFVDVANEKAALVEKIEEYDGMASEVMAQVELHRGRWRDEIVEAEEAADKARYSALSAEERLDDVAAQLNHEHAIATALAVQHKKDIERYDDAAQKAIARIERSLPGVQLSDLLDGARGEGEGDGDGDDCVVS